MILAVGNSGTYEVDAFGLVEKNLVAMGHQVVLFKQDKCLENDFFTFELKSGQATYYVTINGSVYKASDFSAIWYIHPHLPKELLEIEPAEYRPFIKKQFHSMLQGMWSVFRDRKWVNDPWNANISENKIWQLTLASELGFLVPETVITSNPKQVNVFFKTHPEGIIVKLLGTSPLLDRVIYTNVVTSEYMEQIQSVKFSPAIFQVLLQKSFELRITVVDDQIFPIKIHSQDDPKTAIDWRTQPKVNDFNVKMEATNLPQRIQVKIFELMRRMGLKYGCVDMVVTKNGEYVFLEINPSGQWHFVQLKTGVDIAKALAKLLVR